MAARHRIHVAGRNKDPLHCPSVDDVEFHPLDYDAATAELVPGSAVGKRIAIPWTHRAVPKLRQALTVEAPYVPGRSTRPRPTLFYKREGNYLFTSRMAFVKANLRAELDVRTKGTALPAGTKYTNPRGLFAFQEKVVQLTMQRLKKIGGAMIVAPCGMGKSELMGKSVEECGVHVLVMVPKCAIAEQLVDLFRARFPMLTVEQMDGAHKKATADTHIIVAVTNSAANAPKELFANRGLVMLDEAHHGPAKTVQRALDKCPAAYVLGLTATPKRSDGCDVVFPYMFGPIVATVHRPWMPAIIRGVCFTDHFHPDPVTFNDALNELAQNPAWTTMVLDAILGLARRAKANGGRVLVLVDRRRAAMELCEHASGGGVVTDKQWTRQRKEETNKKTGKWEPPCVPRFARPKEEVAKMYAGLTSSLYVGVVMTVKELRAAKVQGDIVWCTKSKADEGLDLKNIHKEGLFCKASHPQQHVGRCLRVTTMAAVPEVVFSAEVHVQRLQRNQRSQVAYFEQHEGWPIEWIPQGQTRETLARNGKAPTAPTRVWKGHKRKERLERQRGSKRKRGLE